MTDRTSTPPAPGLREAATDLLEYLTPLGFPSGRAVVYDSPQVDRLRAALRAESVAAPAAKADEISVLAEALTHRGEYPVNDRIEPERYRLAADIQRALHDSGYVIAAAPPALDAAPSPELRKLSAEATPGPWHALTHGTASQRDAAGRAYEAVMARRVADSPDIQFTDLSWIDTGPADPHIGLTGNGPDAPENAKFIAAAANFVRDLLSGSATPASGEPAAAREETA